MRISSFGQISKGTPVELYTLSNDQGVQAAFSDYGGTWVSMRVCDRKGDFGDVLLGFDDVAGYEENACFASITGRYANRIAKGRFAIDDEKFELDINDPPNHLHGGGQANISRKIWDAEYDASDNRLIFRTVSADGEAGYPGKLSMTVSYTLTARNEVIIDYSAMTDKPTPINLTNHAYFNLDGTPTINNHLLQLNAENYTPFDDFQIPTGEVVPVEASLDFRVAARLGEKIEALSKMGRPGLDHNLVFDDWDKTTRLVGALTGPESGRRMEIETSEPSAQLYTANHLSGTKGKRGASYKIHAGICIETQHYPDSPNHPHFPDTLLRPGQVYRSRTIYRFVAADAG